MPETIQLRRGFLFVYFYSGRCPVRTRSVSFFNDNRILFLLLLGFLVQHPPLLGYLATITNSVSLSPLLPLRYRLGFLPCASSPRECFSSLRKDFPFRPIVPINKGPRRKDIRTQLKETCLFFLCSAFQ